MAEGDQPTEKPSVLQGMETVILGGIALLCCYGYTLYQYFSDRAGYFSDIESAGSSALVRFFIFSVIWGMFISWKWPRSSEPKL